MALQSVLRAVYVRFAWRFVANPPLKKKWTFSSCSELFCDTCLGRILWGDPRSWRSLCKFFLELCMCHLLGDFKQTYPKEEVDLRPFFSCRELF